MNRSERQREWCKKNPEKIKEHKRRWREANPDKVRLQKRLQMARKRKANPDKFRERDRIWRRANRDKVRLQKRKTRERREDTINALIDSLKLAILFKDSEIERLQRALKQQRSNKTRKTGNGRR